MPWTRWVNDPLLDTAGLTFDRTPQGTIVAPPGKFRVCAYHVDHDERPTVFQDVPTLAEALDICKNLRAHDAGNVDYGVVYDDTGAVVAGGI